MATMADVESWKSRDGAKAGIVSTVRSAGRSLLSFVAWHLRSGFAHMWLYLDDPLELLEVRELLKEVDVDAIGKVTLIPCDSSHRLAWTGLSQWRELAAIAETEAQARQLLNAEHAVGLANALQLAWLLHIDADEAFYCNAGHVGSHFAALMEEGVASMQYVNFEAVAERMEISDPFLDCTLFRRHPAAVWPGSLGETQLVEEAFNFWFDRGPHQHYFEGYCNGKSVVAVMPGAVPISVHLWQPGTPHLQRGHNFVLGGTPPERVHSRLVHSTLVRKACVLHFNAAVGYSAWRRKYEVLGEFPDSWFAGKTPMPPGFHRDSRDICASGDETAALAFYSRRVVLDDPHEIERQLASGLCMRIPQVGDVLRANVEQLELSPTPAAGHSC